MIDFRYHVVSLVAVLLALALGIVVGTTTLRGSVVHDLHGRVAGLASDKQGLQDQVSALRGQVDADHAFTRTVAPLLVGGKLTGRHVAIVSAPGVDVAARSAAAAAVTAAGGVVSADVRLSAAFVDPAKAPLLDDLATRLVPAGLTLPKGEPAGRAATVLADALVDRDGSGDPAFLGRVLGAYREVGLVTVAGSPQPATMALLLTGSGPAATTAAAKAALLPLAATLHARSAAAVLVTPRDADRALREVAPASGKPTDRVSTVDAVDTPEGEVATVLALAAQARDTPAP